MPWCRSACSHKPTKNRMVMIMGKIKYIFAWLFILFTAAAIFMFSSQPSEKSSDVSNSVSEKLFSGEIEKKYSEELNKQYGHELKRETRLKIFNGFVRKNAHFAIFFLFGISAYNLMRLYIKNKYYAALTALGISVLYACSDEFHQLFVEGRGAGILDVFIDSAGALCGIILFVAVLAAIRKWGKRNV